MDTNKYIEATIVDRKDFSDDLWSCRLKLAGEFSFQPGQYATFGVEKDGKLIQRPYSIVSSPHEDELEFFFELVPHGELTPLLHGLQVGDKVVVRKTAKGRFLLDRDTGSKKHFMVSTVTGLAPFSSMVRQLRADNEKNPPPEGFQVVVLQGASRSWELGFREEFEQYARELPWLHYIPTVSRPWEDADWKGEVGRCEDVLRKYCDQFNLGPDDTTGYLCGHPGMIENCKGILQRKGFSKESLREEQYWVQK